VTGHWPQHRLDFARNLGIFPTLRLSLGSNAAPVRNPAMTHATRQAAPTRAALLVTGLAALLLPFTALAAEHPPANHAGADLKLANGDVIWGNHTDIGTLTIPDGAVVTVKPYDGTWRVGNSEPESGTLRVTARRIEINGTLGATGAGFAGGGGGGGASGTDVPYPGFGGVARYSTGISGEALKATNGTVSWCGTSVWFNGCQFGGGGKGSRGDGPDGGINEGVANSEWERACGGYASGRGAGFNEDSSTDESVLMGSGGSGGRGGNASGGGGGLFGSVYFGGFGGSAGGSGGGKLSLNATESFTLGPNATIEADGTMGQPQTLPTGTALGVNGQNATQPYAGGTTYPTNWNLTGGAGSGGGILIKCTAPNGLDLSPTAIVSTLGGGDLVQNGGTVKIFYKRTDFSTTLPTIRSGHRLISTITTSAAASWCEYQ
jgi:hypothetical protein